MDKYNAAQCLTSGFRAEGTQELKSLSNMQMVGPICDASFHRLLYSCSLFLLFIALSGSWKHSALGTRSEGAPKFWGKGTTAIGTIQAPRI